MKLIGGRTLADLLKERESPEADLVRWISVFEHIAQTIGYAHSKGVIHRDLKPANIMVGDFGEVQVMDWGLAKGVDEEDFTLSLKSKKGKLSDEGSTWLTSPGSVLGTLYYMSPEQARSEGDLDCRTDVFSLGAMLCEILTGKPPFTGRSRTELVEKVSGAHTEEAIERLSDSEADPELIALAKQCLAADRQDRPKDGEEVAERIAHCRESVERRLRDAEAERARVEIMIAERRKRQIIRRALGAAVALLVFSGIGFAWWWERTKTDRELREAQLAMEESERARAEAKIQQREEQNRSAIEDLLKRAADSLKMSDYEPSLALIAEVGTRLDQGGADDLKARYDQLSEELEFLRKLQELDEEGWFSSNMKGPQGVSVLVGKIEGAFRNYGIVPGETPMADVLSKINRAEIHFLLLGTLERWHLINGDIEVRKILAEADPDPVRNRIRESSFAEVKKSLKKTDVFPPQPSWFATTHARGAKGLDELSRRALLTASYEQNPDDFSLVMKVRLKLS